MIPRPRIPRLAGTARAALCALLLLSSGRAYAQSRADSVRAESAPGRLLVPQPLQAPPANVDMQSPGAVVAVDTAAAGVHRRSREAFGRGLMMEEQQAYGAAIISYVNAAKIDPTLRGPCYRVGLLYVSRQQWVPALKAFREELRRDPDSHEAGMEYALALSETGDTTHAIRRLEELTRRAPGDARIWRAMGVAYARANRLDAAEKALRGSVRLDAKNARAWRDLGVVLAARHRNDEARSAYRRALAVEPRDETALVNLANLESGAGFHAVALSLYHDAEALDSTRTQAYRGQIRELVLLQREADAGAVWRRWLAAAKDDAEVREGAARHFVHQGRTDVALQLARDAVRESPKSSDAWWLLGEMQAQAGDHRGALAAYRESYNHTGDLTARLRTEQSIDALRIGAPDSLRAFFAADSVTAAADTTRNPARR